MKSILTNRKLLPFVILGALLLLTILVLMNPPQSDQKGPEATPGISVEVLPLTPQPFQANITSYGTVEPRTQSKLVSQVGGMVTTVSADFRDGGFFNKGDVLLAIDDRDYQADVSMAEANLLDARQQLAEEEAQSEQAQADWQRLGNEGSAPDLVLRKPQLLAAQAKLKSAQAALKKARLNLERTSITAPFDGRIRETLVDRGQVVSANSELADIYASDVVEVRLPLCTCDLDMVELPENRPGEEPRTIPVTLHSSLQENRQWQGRIVRTEAAIDDSSRQLHVVAQIDDPFTGGVAIKIGEYVTADIEGRTLEKALTIPVSTIYQGSHVYIVEENLLMRREIDILWQNSESAIIEAGVNEGDLLVITPLGQVTSGTRVTIASTDESGLEGSL